jgi:hypothetical protein
MKIPAITLLSLISLNSMAIENRPVAPKEISLRGAVAPIQTHEVKFDFQSVSVSQIIGLIYSEALKQPYVMDLPY